MGINVQQQKRYIRSLLDSDLPANQLEGMLRYRGYEDEFESSILYRMVAWLHRRLAVVLARMRGYTDEQIEESLQAGRLVAEHEPDDSEDLGFIL